MTLEDILNAVDRRLGALERRQAGMVTRGKVAEVDAAKGLVRLRLNPDDDDAPFLSPWIPYAQQAGALKVHAPPSKGQQMTMMSAGGDYTQALAVSMTWSDDNKSPSDKADENVMTFGPVRAELTGSGLKVTIGEFSLDMTGSGATYTVGGVTHKIDGSGVDTTGGQVKHNSKSIGGDHRHNGVMTGAGNTGVPI